MSSNCGCANCCQPPRWQRESHPDFDTVFSMLRQDGLLETDRDHPMIGVCSTWNEIVPGHLHLRDLAEQVKLGIRSSGGVGLEYGCVAPCDGAECIHSEATPTLATVTSFPCATISPTASS